MRITTVDEVAGAVRLARKKRGWTQAHLAAQAHVSRDLVNRLERGSGRVEVAKVLDILAALSLATVIEPRRSPVDLAAIVRALAREERTFEPTSGVGRQPTTNIVRVCLSSRERDCCEQPRDRERRRVPGHRPEPSASQGARRGTARLGRHSRQGRARSPPRAGGERLPACPDDRLVAVRVDRALHRPADQRTAWDFGDLGWVADLDPDDQVAFLDGFLTLLVKNANADDSDEVENYLADWRATAHAWADPDTRAALLEDLTAPLHDVEL